jgi:GTPase SAR1 family protein
MNLMTNILIKFNKKMYKILFLGDACVGKTTYIDRCSMGDFVEDYEKTKNFKANMVKMTDNSYVCIQVPGIAEDIENIIDDINAVVLMYDITCKISRRNLSNWKRSYNDNIPTIVVGTHNDGRRNFKDTITIDGIVYSHTTISSKHNYNFEKPFLILDERLGLCSQKLISKF